MEEENLSEEVESALYRQAYATAKAVCSAFEKGMKAVNAKTEMYLPQFPEFKAEISIKLTVE